MLIQRLPTTFNVKTYWQQLPDVSLSHLLLRIPLSLLFINQGLSKFPFDPVVGQAMGIPALVWWFVCYGEVVNHSAPTSHDERATAPLVAIKTGQRMLASELRLRAPTACSARSSLPILCGR